MVDCSTINSVVYLPRKKSLSINTCPRPNQLLLLSIPSSIALSIAISPKTIAQSQPKTAELPKVWKVQSIAAPKFVQLTPHQAFIAQQKLKDRKFYCDCYSCRLAAAQMGITLN